MEASQSTFHCFVCGRSEQVVPLVQFRYQGKTMWICPQDLPALIHHPEQVAEKLAGSTGTESHTDFNHNAS